MPHGQPMLVGRESEAWLQENYPGLAVTENGLSGTIEFRATYDKDANYFVVLPRGFSATITGVVLSCKFDITITERTDKTLSELPALHVQGVEPIIGRHFGQQDYSACLCSLFVEPEYLRPTFQFRRYFEELAVPFLYGQEFFNQFSQWPWEQFEHGGTGLLESYFDVNADETVRCIEKLAATSEWSVIRRMLKQRAISGRSNCVCRKPKQMWRCHNKALRGLKRLHQEVRRRAIRLP